MPGAVARAAPTPGPRTLMPEPCMGLFLSSGKVAGGGCRLARALRTSEGSLALRAIARAATLYSVGSAGDPDHEAAMRFGGEAPRERAHSVGGIAAIAQVGSPLPRIVIGASPRPVRRAPKLCVRQAG